MIATSTEISVKGKWVRVPALEVNGKTLVITGGWIRSAAIQSEQWLETELEDPELYVKRLREQRLHGLRIDVFTFAQKLPAKVAKYRYPVDWESTAAVRTTSFRDWWDNLPQATRKNVRRSQKRGVRVELKNLDNDLVHGIVEINNESPVRQGGRSRDYGKSFDQVKRDHSSFLDRSDFICAYCGDELIGLLKLVYRGDIASILQLLVKAAHHDKRPANALVTKAVELCAAGGLSYLTYARFNYGNKSDCTLTEFKARHGFEEVLVPRYYVPLTALGALYTRLRLYRGSLGILPGGVIAAGLKARLAWYHVKDFSSRCSSKVEQPNRNRPMECSNPPAGSSSNA